MNYILILTTILAAVCIAVRHSASMPTFDEFYDPLYEEPMPQCKLYHCNDDSNAIDIDCNCDRHLCWKRQKCCLNYLHSNNVNSSTYYFGIPKADIERGQLYQCHVVNPPDRQGYSVISKCGTSKTITTESWLWQKSQCEQSIRPGNNEDYLLRIPVSSYITGETYKNIYCAACHNDLENITFWNTSIVCIDNRINYTTEALHNLYVYNDGKKLPNCVLKIKPTPDVKEIPCTTQTVSYITWCPSSFLNMSTSAEDMDKRREIEWLCQVTSNPVNVNGTKYENPYCAACHLNDTDIGAIISSKHGQCHPVKDDADRDDGPKSDTPTSKPFAVLLDFIPFSKNGNQVAMTRRCSPGYIYYGLTKECKLIILSEDYAYYNNEQRAEISTTVGMNNISNHLPNQTSSNTEVDVSVLNCSSIVQIQRSDVVVNDNGTMTEHHQKLHPQGTFLVVDNDTVHVCGDSNDNYVFEFDGATHIYMTSICSLLSLLALLLKMVIIALISEIRQFPDKLVFCLCASLFIAQLLLLTTVSPTTNYTLCASIAVFTHYFFLCSICWMNVIAYDIWNTFTKGTESRLIRSDSMIYRFYGYSLYAWVTPMLLVSAACVFEWSGIVDESSIMRPLYGVNLCWINARTALLFYFAIPVAFLLLSNIAFFVLTAIYIYRSSRALSKIQSTDNSQSCFNKQSRSPLHLKFSIYVKLSVVMGFTWITGFVASVSGQEWLWYVFTLTSASQGVYILIALTSFKTVWLTLQHRYKLDGKNSLSARKLHLNGGNDLTQSEMMKSSLEKIPT